MSVVALLKIYPNCSVPFGHVWNVHSVAAARYPSENDIPISLSLFWTFMERTVAAGRPIAYYF